MSTADVNRDPILASQLGDLRKRAALAQQERDLAESAYTFAQNRLEVAKETFRAALARYTEALDADLREQVRKMNGDA